MRLALKMGWERLEVAALPESHADDSPSRPLRGDGRLA
jgi:hypothetical protein